MRLAIVTTMLALSAACFPARSPMPLERYSAPQTDTLLVLLPGFAAYDHTFEKKGLIQAAREAGFEGDIVAPNATFGYYRTRSLLPELESAVFADARDKYEHIWVLGISMGGLGTLLAVEEFREDIDGVILLSPFLGRKRVTNAVRDAGGLAGWSVPEEDPTFDEEVWGWLDDASERQWQQPEVFLGYASNDLGVKNQELLASQMGHERSKMVPGGHTWPVWKELLHHFVKYEMVPRVQPSAGIVAAPTR